MQKRNELHNKDELQSSKGPHRSHVVDVGGRRVGAHTPEDGHDEQGEYELVAEARSQKPRVLQPPQHPVLQWGFNTQWRWNRLRLMLLILNHHSSNAGYHVKGWGAELCPHWTPRAN